jgi:hypothetical protein
LIAVVTEIDSNLCFDFGFDFGSADWRRILSVLYLCPSLSPYLCSPSLSPALSDHFDALIDHLNNKEQIKRN